MSKKKLIILGTGFTAFSIIRDLDVNAYSVLVVSPRNHFVFTPLLPSTTVGTIEFRSISEPIRAVKRGVEYYQGECVSIDLQQKSIVCRHALEHSIFSLPYDILIIAVGAENNTYNIPGVAENALFLRELADARAIRQGIIECFERASTPGLNEEERKRLLHFVVVGGGPTGVEFAAEMNDFLEDDLSKAFPRVSPDFRITLLEATDQILSSFDAALGKYTIKQFQRSKIDVRTGSIVTRVEQDRVFLKDGSELRYGLLVWSTGIGPNTLVRSLPFEKDKHQRITVDEFFRVKGQTDVYAAGDCAVIHGQDYPATAQVAQQEGRYIARRLNRMSKGKSAEPFQYKNLGMLAYVGGNRALADLPNVKGSGYFTWLFWRSVYLTRLVSLKNKILVIFDWVKAMIFGRDISRF
ncbi:MAG TPA: FAD-dependent oxidoreductase [Bacteroidota bacterium]|jgi:NADH:ubiquinone reductase (non-electrogenic)|nr:FAD-dependent oxidoreductase [Bacteroidota bacterium]